MKMLFSAYRLDQYPDPDGFMAQAALILSEYPVEVICYVTDPRTGLQRDSKWPPTINEIAEACNSRLVAIERQAELEKWQAKRRDSAPLAPKFSCGDGLITYGEFLARFPGQRPIGAFEG